MGYLSCKTESAISIISTTTTTTGAAQTRSSRNASSKKQEKPIKLQRFDYGDLEAATNGFSDQKLLGKGSHGSVYKAVVRGRRVAIKKPSRVQETGQEMDNEIEILSKINNPRLVNLLGFTDNTRDRLLVVEFMSNGTLYDVLHSNSNSNSNSVSNSNYRPMNWGRRIRSALQVAKAVEILHSQTPPIIHRDIKSANVLIDRNFNARLGDFGLALRCGLDDYRLRSTPPAGTMGYLDPNYVTPDNLSTKTDVFSFGILLLEILSGRKAIDISHSPPSIVDWAIPLIKKGKFSAIYDPSIQLLKDIIVRKQLALIASKCVRTCRERRPSMKEVVDWLNGLSKLVPLHSWNGFNNPCMMVETVGHPVGYRKPQQGVRGMDSDRKLVSQAMRDSQRVYSDLGFRSNLMELMAGSAGSTDEESQCVNEEPGLKSGNRVSSSRFRGGGGGGGGGGGFGGKHKGLFGLRRNKSAGGCSELYSGGCETFAKTSYDLEDDSDV